jgi:hypothetical protein
MAASPQGLSYYYESTLLLSFMMKVKSNRSKIKAPNSAAVVHFKIISTRCHPEHGDSRARDPTTADAVDVVDGTASASCSVAAPRISTTGVWVS